MLTGVRETHGEAAGKKFCPSGKHRGRGRGGEPHGRWHGVISTRGERSFRKLNGASQGAGSAAFAAGAVIKCAFFRLLRELLLKFEGKKKNRERERKMGRDQAKHREPVS